MSYSSEVLADVPVAYWRLGDTSGIVAFDSAPNGTNPGTYTGGCTLGQRGIPAGDDTSVLYDGSTGFVTAPNSTSLNITGTAITLEAWIKRRGATAAFAGIASKLDAAGTKGYQLRSDNAGTNALAQVVTGAVLRNASHSANVWDGQWHHWVGVYDGATWALYIDGILGDNFAATGTIADSATQAFVIADQSDGANKIAATIDEVAVYNTPLSSARVLVHYNVGISSIITLSSSPTIGRFTLSGKG